jgi:hypothetical protein
MASSKFDVKSALVGASAVLAAGVAGYFLGGKQQAKKAGSAQNSHANKAPLRVVITGAAGMIGYSLIPLICGGSVFGEDQPIILHLLDLPMAEKALGGIGTLHRISKSLK